MARSLRNQCRTASYYTTSRGNERQTAAKGRADRIKCLSCWQPSTSRDNAAFYANTLMDSQDHLLIPTPSGSFPPITRHITSACATYLNLKGDRFSGTYPRGAIKPSGLHRMPTA